MTLRRPAAHQRRTPGWRRSGDESCWESLMSDGEFVPRISCPQRAPRPQSAIEGGQLDQWLEHLQRMQNDLFRPAAEERLPAFSDRTTSTPVLNKQHIGRTWSQGIPSCSWGSSTCETPSLYESSFGSQESLQTGIFSPSEHKGSWERAHIMQAPTKEQAKLSFLAPVKIGWLPVQRRVMMTADACNQTQLLDQQVKLKQPITPIFQKNLAMTKTHDVGEEGRHSHSSPLGVRTWQTADQRSNITQKVPEKQSFPATEVEKPVSWQALRRGWNSVRASAFPGCSQSIGHSSGTNSVPNRKFPLMKITSVEPLKHTPLYQATSTEPCGTDTLVRATSSRDTNKSHTPLHRIGSVEPVRATAPLFRTNSSSQPSHIETNAAVTTLIPQNKAGFSSITISSKKVSRSSSLPGSNSCTSSSPSSESTSPPPQAHQSMDPNSRQVTMQRKATIVKVTEQRVTSSHVPCTKSTDTPPASHALDTVVHRRKATIIKVTERRESYSPAMARSGTRHPEYRHSYTEGVLKDNKTWSQGSYSQNIAVPLYHQSDSTKRPNSVVAPNTSTPDPEKNGGTLHRSTLSLFVSNPPAITAPAPSEVSLRAVGQRSERPRRPLSCYGNVFVHTEPSKENVTQPAARKWSFGPPQETSFNPVNSDISFIRPGTALKKGGQLVADTLKPNRGEREISPLPEDKARRASPSLTLIKAPDPHSHQTPEEVLALNAAAIIANIKLQRQLSAKKTPKGNSEDSIAPTQGNTDTCAEPCPDQSPVQQCNRPHAAFVPLSLNPKRPTEMFSLQEALQRSRPDFIIRSQGRVQELERKAQERKQQENSAHPQSHTTLKHKGALSTRTAPLNDNLFKPRDKVITGKEMHLRSKRTPFWYNTTTELRRKKDEEKNKEASLSNRQRVELFKKKLLDQILQRHNN